MSVLALFGDTHGHLRLMLLLAHLWQQQHGQRLDGILICGDLGYFPDLNRLDSATRRHALKDPEELGFAKYFGRPQPLTPDELTPRLLKQVTCPIHWCHGNHEDFQALAQLSDLQAADCYGRLLYHASGQVHRLGGWRVAALGGGPEPSESPHACDPRWIDVSAVSQLRQAHFEVLLAHGAPQGIGGESEQWGSRWMRHLIELRKPDFCFFGHHRTKVGPGKIGPTQCFWLNDVAFDESQGLEPECMGILSEQSFSLVEEDWLKTVTADTWLHLA